MSLSVTVTAPATAGVGETIEVVVDVSNSGLSPVRVVQVHSNQDLFQMGGAMVEVPPLGSARLVYRTVPFVQGPPETYSAIVGVRSDDGILVNTLLSVDVS